MFAVLFWVMLFGWCWCVRDAVLGGIDCASSNEIKAREPIRCRECGCRVLYKKRVKRSEFSVLLYLCGFAFVISVCVCGRGCTIGGKSRWHTWCDLKEAGADQTILLP